VAQAELDEVAADEDVVGLHLLEVAHEGVEDLGAVPAVPAQAPGDIPEGPLADEVPEARPRRRGEVGIGQVGEGQRGVHLREQGSHGSCEPERDLISVFRSR